MAQEYAIAAGYNNAGSLTVIESLTDGTNTFNTIALTAYSRGVARFRADGSRSFEGVGVVQWRSVMTWAQLEYLIDNYEGQVTVKTRLYRRDGAYANYNAILRLEPDIAFDRTTAGTVVWSFMLVEAL